MRTIRSLPNEIFLSYINKLKYIYNYQRCYRESWGSPPPSFAGTKNYTDWIISMTMYDNAVVEINWIRFVCKIINKKSSFSFLIININNQIIYVNLLTYNKELYKSYIRKKTFRSHSRKEIQTNKIKLYLDFKSKQKYMMLVG